MAVATACQQVAKERLLVSIESHITEVMSYARKVEQDFLNRYRELTGESDPECDNATGVAGGSFAAMHADLHEIRRIIENIDRKFGNL